MEGSGQGGKKREREREREGRRVDRGAVKFHRADREMESILIHIT